LTVLQTATNRTVSGSRPARRAAASILSRTLAKLAAIADIFFTAENAEFAEINPNNSKCKVHTFVKRMKKRFSVIPAKAGIQCFWEL
jgi:hypothetical protein